MTTQPKFKDFNFKLAVIQVLMYEKELLKPKFDLYDFVANHKQRAIDMDKEGYKIIPEAKKYFEDLEMPSELLAQVETIYQDGGNEIYHQLIPFWDGEDDVFNITSTDDLELLPNLKNVIIFFDNTEKMVGEFKSKGIDAEYL
jgi:hypothetical protein